MFLIFTKTLNIKNIFGFNCILTNILVNLIYRLNNNLSLKLGSIRVRNPLVTIE